MRSGMRKDAELAQKCLKGIATTRPEPGRQGKLKKLKKKKKISCSQRIAYVGDLRPIRVGKSLILTEKLPTPRRHDGREIARDSPKPCAKLRPPMAPRRVLFQIPDR
jgi:hypothetical protein